MRRAMLPLVLTLLAVPTCASVPAYAPRDGTMVAAELPPFPTWVPSRHGAVPVTLVRHLQCGGSPAFGCYHYPTRQIEIEDTLPLVLRWRYIRHEIVHMAVYDAGLSFDSPTAENYVAEAMATQQITEMLSGWPR